MAYLLNELGLYRRVALCAYDLARPLFERAATLYEEEWGPEHPFTAAVLNNLATVLYNQGDLIGAQCLLERALAIYVREFGEDHPRTVHVLNSLGRLHTLQRNLPDARSYFERALANH